MTKETQKYINSYYKVFNYRVGLKPCLKYGFTNGICYSTAPVREITS